MSRFIILKRRYKTVGLHQYKLIINVQKQNANHGRFTASLLAGCDLHRPNVSDSQI